MSKPFTVFTMEYLRWRSEHGDEPRTSSEAETAGPWWIVPLLDGTHGLFRCGERPLSDTPTFVFKDREDALLASAVLPSVGRDPLYRIRPEETPKGFAIESEGAVVGHSLLFNEDVAAALHVASCLLRSPLSLARLLEAAGGQTLDHAGKILLGGAGEGGKG
jgi:hypothetical protein